MNKNNSKVQELNSLAIQVNKQMTINKYLNKQFEQYNLYNTLSKDIITKSMIDKNISSIELFKEYAEKIEKDNEKYKNEFEKINLKYNILKEQCTAGELMENIVSEKNNEQFILNYSLIEKKNTINSLKKCIKISKNYNLAREPIRDNFIEMKDSKNQMENCLKDFHKNMIFECKGYNKKSNIIKRLLKKKEILSKNKKLLKDYIQTKEKSNDEFKIPITHRHQRKKFKIEHITDDEEEYNKSKKNIFSEFKKLEDLFNISSEEGENEKIIDEELHSDEDYNFIGKIQIPKQLSTHYLNNIKSNIPKFDFNQIIYNKSKNNKEIDLYSLERRNYKYLNIDNKLKNMKKKINKINDKIIQIKLKEKTMKDYIIKLKEKYKDIKPMIYRKTFIDIPITEDFVSKTLKTNNKILESVIEKDDTIDSICLNENDKKDSLVENLSENNEKRELKEDTKKIKDIKNNFDNNYIKYNLGKFSRKNINKIGKSVNINVPLIKNMDNKEEKNHFQPICILKSSRINNLKSNTERARSK